MNDDHTPHSDPKTDEHTETPETPEVPSSPTPDDTKQ